MSDDKWMSEEEWGSWMGARVKPEPVDAPGGKKKKATQSQLNLALLEFSIAGNYESAMAVIEEGANVNARTRANPGDSVLSLAIRSGHENLALELIRRGAYCAPRWHRSSDDSADFDKSAASGKFSSAQKEHLGAVAVKLFIQNGSTWQALVSVRDLCMPSKSNEELLAQAFKADRFDLALQAAKSGVTMSENVWSQADQTFEHRYLGLKDHRQRKEFLELISDRSRIEEMTVSVVKKLYRSAIDGEDVVLMKALLDARLRPGADWSVDSRVNYYDNSQDSKEKDSKEKNRRSIVWSAAKLAAPEMLRLLKSCAPAMAAARRQKEPPESMELVPIGRVMELMEAGIPIDGVNENGEGLAHIWAKDREPRDGWATLARKAPEVFAIKNKAGRCGHELMAEKLRNDVKDDFLAALSRIETREIKRDVAPLKGKVEVPKPKRL
jgi:hypothetical protein